jgi:purine-nucleoside phosphorylase
MSATRTVEFLQSRLHGRPRILLILGSGLGRLGDELSDATSFPFDDVPGFARSTVAGHRGRLIAGKLEGVDCLALQGRYHMYEGHSAEVIALPVRVAAALGVRIMIVTNAAGGVRRTFRAGDLMIIDDHINMMWRNPLIGPLQAGEQRFPDMSHPYDPELQALAERVAHERGQPVQRGTYMAVLGPSYETPAEIRMCAALGADAIGMSTVPEVITARALGMRVLGISLISNVAAGLSPVALSHDEVIEAAQHASAAFAGLIRGVIAALGVTPDPG